MPGAEDDVRKLLEAKAKREADEKAANDVKDAKVQADAAERERLLEVGKAKWPAIYQMLRGIFDTWQPALNSLGLESQIGGVRHDETRYLFQFSRKDARAYVKLWFALSQDAKLNVAIEKFTDVAGLQNLQPQFLTEREDAARPFFAAAVTEMEEYAKQVAGQRPQFDPKPAGARRGYQ